MMAPITLPLELQDGAALQIPATVETPALVVDLDIVRRNLIEMAEFAKSVEAELYPHIKTHRTIEFARMQMELGASGLCVAKLSEAEILVEADFTDIVMAYPIAGEHKYARALDLSRRSRLSLSTDSSEATRALGAYAAERNQTVDLLLLVDTGFHRTGVLPDLAVEMARRITDTDGLRFRGIITHEGHAAGKHDRAQIESSAREAGEVMARVASRIRSSGIGVEVVSVGSTTTARFSSAVDGVNQLRPGIYPFNDLGQVVAGTVSVDRCAARVLATVVSHAAPDRAILDAGSKSLGQDLLGIWFDGAEAGHGLLVGHPGWKLHALSEEHGWMRWEGEGPPTPLMVGQTLQVLPNHICSAFHAVGESVIVERGEVVASWQATARGCSR